jgi:hypothetical protein
VYGTNADGPGDVFSAVVEVTCDSTDSSEMSLLLWSLPSLPKIDAKYFKTVKLASVDDCMM